MLQCVGHFKGFRVILPDLPVLLGRLCVGVERLVFEVLAIFGNPAAAFLAEFDALR